MNNTRIDTSALRTLLGNITPTATWITTETSRMLPGGGELTVRGFTCSGCGFFRRKNHGVSKFCEDCGARMEVTA